MTQLFPVASLLVAKMNRRGSSRSSKAVSYRMATHLHDFSPELSASGFTSIIY